jgi:hypothetical protein
MRTKLTALGIVLAAGFLAAGVMTSTNLWSASAKQTGLPVSIEYIVVEDGECTTDPDIGEVGWCPDGSKSTFLVEVSGLTEESMVIARLIVGGSASEGTFANSCTAHTWVNALGTERDLVRQIPCGAQPADGTDLRLTIINPP